MRLKSVVAGVAAAVLIGSLAYAQERTNGFIGITVFEDAGYRGRNATFREDVSDLSDFHLNDRVSSFRIDLGETTSLALQVSKTLTTLSTSSEGLTTNMTDVAFFWRRYF